MHRVAFYVVALAAASWPLVFDSALKGTVLLVLVAITAVCMRNASAATRYLAWMLGVIGLLLLPIFSAILPGYRVLPQWAGTVIPARTTARASVSPPLNSPTQQGVVGSVVGEPRAGVEFVGAFIDRLAPGDRAANPFPLQNALKDSTFAVWFRSAWISIASLLLLRLGASILLLRMRLRATTAPVTAGPLQDALENACVQLQVRQRVRLFVDDRRIVPLVWGVFRPRLVLPTEAHEWEPERLHAVLLHELAHVKRRDVLVMLLTQLACAVHWFNPLAWLAAWRLHIERERACDDLVLSAGVKASDYAEHLLHVATRLETASPAGALAMARPSQLEGRLMAVLNQQLKRSTVTGPVALLAAAISLSIIIPVAMLRAQEKPATSPDATTVSSGELIEGNSTTSAAAEAPKSQHTMEVKADGSLTFDATALSDEALAEKLTALSASNPNEALTLRAEKNAPYASVAKVLEACRSARIANVTIAAATDIDKETAKVQITGAANRSEPAAELAGARLDQAKRDLERISELRKQNVISPAELDRAKAEVEIRKAELAGDSASVMRTRLELAERGLARVSELNKQKLVSQQELDHAKAEVDMRKAELARDSAAVMRARLQLAERDLQRLSELNKQKLVSQQELDRAKAEVDIIKAELAGDSAAVMRARLQLAERDLQRLSELNKQKLVSEQELENAKFEADLRRAELAGDLEQVRQTKLRQAQHDLERLTSLYEQKLVSQEEIAQAKANVDMRLTELTTTTWQPFSQERVDQALKAGRPVFIQFTADWSVDSKVNESRVLNTAAVASAFASRNVLTLKADWTDGNKVVTDWLRKFPKPGVPLYLLYTPGKAEPHVFPDLLKSEDIIRELARD